MNNRAGAIGVFDSGMGGISVLGELLRQMPTENYIYYGDSANAPYGEKSTSQVVALSRAVCAYLVKAGCKAIVIACNTATSAAVKELREAYNIPIIGMEPALKPAVEHAEEGAIAVMATEVTLRERKFAELVKRYGDSRTIHSIPCPPLVPLVEAGHIKGEIVENAVRQCFLGVEPSTIQGVVLGCTHFVFLKESVRAVIGQDVQIYDGNFGTARHLQNTLRQMDLLNEKNQQANIEIINSQNQAMVQRATWLLEQYSRMRDPVPLLTKG